MKFDISNYNRADLIAMCVVMALIFALEMLGVFHTRFVTITEIIRFAVPKWLRWMIVGWLTYHFGVE